MIPTLAEALAERGYETLTDVQAAVTAPELEGADLLVSAQTGSGKTVGFGLAIAPTLLGDEAVFGPAALPLALVIAPTRELALQVSRELQWLFGKAGVRVANCIGGMDARDERRALERGAHIAVGTPGRLRDHITRGALDLSAVRAVVLDEADEMLDLGFREDLEFMLAAAPEERRTLLFSATVPPAIADLAKLYQRDAVRVTTLTGATQHSDIAYQAVQVAPEDIEHGIINLLRYHDAPNAIVFANTRAAVNRLMARLANRGFAVVGLSGELSQDERSHALQALRDGRARVCVATDVAARGLDLPNLDLVIHADLPTSTETLLHRSGRTGRAGRKGLAALMVPDSASKRTGRLLRWAKIEADWVYPPSPDEIRARDEERLLADPAWEGEMSEDEAGFAARLMESQSPERIAAACLRLYRSRLSAPEELNTGAGRGERAPKRELGPARWIALSVGQDQGAEARWLLPMLCRAGGLDKTEIGRIRAQAGETYVELAEAAAAGLIARLGDGGLLEEDVFLRALDGVPEAATAPAPRAGIGPRPPRGPGGPSRPSARPPRSFGEDRPPARRNSDAEAGPRPKRFDQSDRPERPRRPDWSDRPERPERAERPDRPKPWDRAGRPEKSDRPKTGDRPRRPAEAGDGPRSRPPRPRPVEETIGERAPKRGGEGKPRPAPRPDSGSKPRHRTFDEGSGPADRPARKPDGAAPKPRRKSAGPDAGGDQRPFRPSAPQKGAALDPSQSLRPPRAGSRTGKPFTGKPGAKPRKPGGPTRKA